jgi:hypothetical protein
MIQVLDKSDILGGAMRRQRYTHEVTRLSTLRKQSWTCTQEQIKYGIYQREAHCTKKADIKTPQRCARKTLTFSSKCAGIFCISYLLRRKEWTLFDDIF